MTCERAGELLFEKIEGRLDDEASTELGRHLADCDACRKEAAELGDVWTLMGNLGEERGNADMRDRFYSMLSAYERGAGAVPERRSWSDWLQGWWPQTPALQLGVVLGALLLGLWLGPRLATGGPRGEIDQLRAEVQTMSRAVTLSLLEHRSASERLRAVSFSQFSGDDTEVTSALLDTITGDPNVNVRLAALDVLAGMVERPRVRSGLLDAFPQQRSPTMQVAMADVLATMEGARPRQEIRRALDDEQLPAPVRTYLERKLSDKGDQI